MARHIRLKEWGTCTDESRTPTESNFELSDRTLGLGPFRFRTDRDGFIDSGIPGTERDDHIVVLGDSVVECMFIPEGQRLTDQAEQFLRSSGRDTKVRNGGATGATSLDLLNSLLNKVLPLKPSAVVLMSGIMDMDCALDRDSFWSKKPYLNSLKNDTAGTSEYLAEADFSDRPKILAVYKTVCQQFQIPLIIATIPHRGYDQYAEARHAWFKNLSGLRKRVNETSRVFCATEGVNIVDLEQVFDGRSDLFYDQFHLNAHGAEVIGTELARRLTNLL